VLNMEIQRYLWFETAEDGPFCLTLVAGAAEDEVIRRFGGDPARARVQTYQQAWETRTGSDGRSVRVCRVGVRTVGEVVVALENGGSHGYVPAILRRLSSGGRACALSWGVNGELEMGYAVAERLVSWSELWGRPELLDPHDAAWDPAWCAGLLEDTHVHEGSLAEVLVMIERMMGVPIDREWFSVPLRTVELPDWREVAGNDAYLI
jgi:hypothetical protein